VNIVLAYIEDHSGQSRRPLESEMRSERMVRDALLGRMSHSRYELPGSGLGSGLGLGFRVQGSGLGLGLGLG
jgi:hypothetical protein